MIFSMSNVARKQGDYCLLEMNCTMSGEALIQGESFGGDTICTTSHDTLMLNYHENPCLEDKFHNDSQLSHTGRIFAFGDGNHRVSRCSSTGNFFALVYRYWLETIRCSLAQVPKAPLCWRNILTTTCGAQCTEILCFEGSALAMHHHTLDTLRCMWAYGDIVLAAS